MCVIIALSGKKKSGKDTVCQDIAAYWRDKIAFSHISFFAFADEIKNFCVNVLGLSPEQCFGSDEDKETPTQYKWEHAPFLAWKFGSKQIQSKKDPNHVVSYSIEDSESLKTAFYSANAYDEVPIGQRAGFMTGRDIMQILGTDMIREVFGNVWCQTTINKIKKHDQPYENKRTYERLSLITDNRFINETESVLKCPYSYVIRLTRCLSSDSHSSELNLDTFDWNRDGCFVLDNKNMSLQEQKKAAESIASNIILDVMRKSF